MTAPQRWIHSSGESTGEERRLLRHGLDVGPPPDAEEQTWKALLAQIGPVGPASPPDAPAPPPPLPAGAAPVAASGLAATKVGALVVTVSTLLLTGYATLRGVPAAAPLAASAPVASVMRPAVHRPEAPDIRVTPVLAATGVGSAAPAPLASSAPVVVMPAASAPPSPVVAVARSAPAERSGEVPSGRAALPARAVDMSAPGETALAATTSTAAVASAATSEPAVSPQATRASRLREESAVVGQANAALRAGDAGEALRVLTDAAGRFPDGVLGQERELLTIEALGQSGQRPAASQRAARFMQAHPGSPHAARLQPYLP